MDRASDQRHTISIDRVRVGLHVRLDGWLGHPFLLNSFKIKDQQEVAALRSLGLREIEYLPHLSDLEPPAAEASADDSDVPLDELMQAKRTRIRRLSRERERIQAAEKKYVKTGNSVANLLNPDLMIHDTAVPKQDAAIVNLRRDLDDRIERTLRPSSLPQDVYDYLSLRKRIGYFIDGAGRMS